MFVHDNVFNFDLVPLESSHIRRTKKDDAKLNCAYSFPQHEPPSMVENMLAANDVARFYAGHRKGPEETRENATTWKSNIFGRFFLVQSNGRRLYTRPVENPWTMRTIVPSIPNESRCQRKGSISWHSSFPLVRRRFTPFAIHGES